MGTREQKKHRKVEREGEQRWFERWQGITGAVLGAIATITAALLPFQLGGSSAGASGTPAVSPSRLTAHLHSPSPDLPLSPMSPAPPAIGVSIAIVGEVEQPHPPPPGRAYVWRGTVHGEPAGSSVFMIDKRTGWWLVSPPAVVSADGAWVVTWVIRTPPVSADWIAVVYSPPFMLYCPVGDTACASGLPFPEEHGVSLPVPQVAGVLATATYSPWIKPSWFTAG